jgi:hypothetical protein
MKAMSKEEKIKEEWINIVGEKNYNFIKQFLNENGFTNRGKYHWLINNFSKEYIKDNFYVTIEIDNDKLFRPKSLQDIENNNGWISVLSENDLPSENKSCWVKIKDTEVNTPFWYRSSDKTFQFNGLVYGIKDVTHYQPITKPQPPIY